MILFKYGLIPSLPDHRDYVLSAPSPLLAAALPPSIDLRPSISWCYDQEAENSCTAQSSSSLIRFLWNKDKKADIAPSRNFVYFNERKLENDIDDDNGAQLRSAMQVLSNTGVCLEASWDYNQQTLFTPPPIALYNQAQANKVATYQALLKIRLSLQSCLSSGYPFVFGMMVHSSFESSATAQTGIVQMPTSQDAVEGGHAVLAVGYDDQKQWYICMNSWGPSWGDKGFFYLPYQFMESNFTFDQWTARV
jgi:C1A family cysteine protease